MIDYIKKNPTFWIFNFVLFILTVGIIAISGVKHVDKILIVAVFFFLSYFAIKKYLPGKRINKSFRFFEKIGSIKYLGEFMFVLCILILFIDILDAGGPPVFKAGAIKTVKELTELRGKIHENSNLLVVYLSIWNIKAFIPFSLFLFLVTDRKWLYYILLILASFYALSMMQKSFIFSVLAPVLVFSIIKKLYIQFSVLLAVAISTIVFLTAQLSHIIDTDPVYNPNPTTEVPYWKAIPIGLAKRVFIVPGEMVSLWFDYIPERKPYLNGDGYNMIAKLKGHRYVDYNTELYPLMRPEYASKGLTGSVNVATFVREYSNFGWIGLFIAAIVLGAFFVIIELIFYGNNTIFTALNFFPILLLSSSNLLTLLFSGGWAILIILYLVFKKQLENSKLCVE